MAASFHNQKQLLELLAAVHRHRIPPPRGTQESLVEYDQRRSVKETLLEEIIDACAETADAARMIRVSMANPPLAAGLGEWERHAEEALAALLRGDAAAVRRDWPKLLRTLDKQPLLYVALGRGGNPQRIVASRGLQYVLRRLLTYLPRLGLLTETCRLLETAQRMETRHPVGAGRHHRVRPRLRDRLQGDRPVPGRLVRRKGSGRLRRSPPAVAETLTPLSDCRN